MLPPFHVQPAGFPGHHDGWNIHKGTKMKPIRSNLSTICVATSLVGIPMLAQAEPITVSGDYHFLDNRSINSIGITEGLRQQFGATNVQPNGGGGTTGTTGTACQASGPFTCGTNSVSLQWDPTTLTPNHFDASRSASLVPDDAWTLTFTNGSDVKQATTLDIVNATVMAHPTNVSISGSGALPTFNWAQLGTTTDAVRIQLWDLSTDIVGTGGATADRVYSQTFSGAKIDFEVTNSLISQNGQVLTLDPTHAYSLEINVLDLRNPDATFNGGIDGRNLNILSMSRSFFDFTLLDQDLANVYLPQSSGGPAPLFTFQPIDVTAGQQIFIDPLLAIGYDYAIGNAADPLFKSVVLPTGIGDGLYDIYIWNGSEYVIFVSGAQGGQSYDFNLDPDADVEGVDRFRVLGIELAAGLDPADATAFITGLTFTADGVFRGTMQAITVSVPEPSTLALLALGALGVLRRKRRAS